MPEVIVDRSPELARGAHLVVENAFFMGPDVAEWIGRFDRGENPGPMMLQMELP